MARKLFTSLKAEKSNNSVTISFNRGLELYNNPKIEKIIRIYRKDEDDFVFGSDYGEYFNSLDYRNAEVIFEGKLDVFNNRKYMYEDKDVKLGSVYAYWVSSNKGDMATGPVAVKVRDPRVWWSHEYISSFINELGEKHHEKVTIKKFGYTTMKRDILGLIAGNPDNTIALTGLIHAGESGPELILPVMAKLLDKDDTLLDKVGIAALPAVNIDQREKLVNGMPYYLRTNPNGVDINRNFNANWDITDYTYGLNTSEYGSLTYRGPYPESENETLAVVNFLYNVNPTVVMSMHSLASICNDNFLASQYGENDKEYVKKCRNIVQEYTRGFRESVASNKDHRLSFTATTGDLSTWAYIKLGIPCFDLEFDGEDEGKACLVDQATVEMIEHYREKHYNGIKEVLKHLAAAI